jgi:hypothetical protein
MDWKKLLFHALVFAAFVPGVLVTLPPGGSRLLVLAVHGLLFAVVSRMVWKVVFKR